MNSREEQLTYILANIGEGTVFSPQELVEGSGISKQLTNANLKRLCTDLVIEQRGRGQYMLQNRGRAIEYLAKAKQGLKAAKPSDILKLQMITKEDAEETVRVVQVVQALRSMGVPGYSTVSQYYANKLREDIEIWKQVLISLERTALPEKQAVEVLTSYDGGVLLLGQRLAPLLGWPAEVFKVAVEQFQERVS